MDGSKHLLLWDNISDNRHTFAWNLCQTTLQHRIGERHTVLQTQCMTLSTDWWSMAIVWSECDVGVMAPHSARNFFSDICGPNICKESTMLNILANSPLSASNMNESCTAQSHETQTGLWISSSVLHVSLYLQLKSNWMQLRDDLTIGY